RPARRSRRSARPAARPRTTCISRSDAMAAPTTRSTCCRSRPVSRTSRRRTRPRPMSDDTEEVIPDAPLDTLADERDAHIREETRETSRANLRVYLREIARIPRLTREEEQALGRWIRAGDEQAKARLVEANLRLVVQVARRRRPSSRRRSG